jgi:hypothetical protein
MGNTIIVALLRSPLGRLLGGLGELEFTGRRSGRAVHLRCSTPEMVTGSWSTSATRPANGGGATSPTHTPVRVHARGATLVGIGRLVRAGDADRPETERVYRRRYPKATLSPHDSMVLIERVPGPAAGPRGTRQGSQAQRRGGLVARHPVRWFIALAYGLAWACWLPLLADRQDWVSWTVSPYLHLAGALGPAVATTNPPCRHGVQP